MLNISPITVALAAKLATVQAENDMLDSLLGVGSDLLHDAGDEILALEDDLELVSAERDAWAAAGATVVIGLAKNLCDVTDQRDHLQNVADNLSAQSTRLSSENVTLVAANAELGRQNENLRDTIVDLTKELDALKAEQPNWASSPTPCSSSRSARAA